MTNWAIELQSEDDRQGGLKKLKIDHPPTTPFSGAKKTNPNDDSDIEMSDSALTPRHGLVVVQRHQDQPVLLSNTTSQPTDTATATIFDSPQDRETDRDVMNVGEVQELGSTDKDRDLREIEKSGVQRWWRVMYGGDGYFSQQLVEANTSAA